MRSLLERAGIALHTGAHPAEARDGELLLVGGAVLPADRVVALPRLQGPRIGGIPQTFEGFVPVDLHGRVSGLDDVFAAGDITTFHVEPGGIAAQQAEAAAEAIAAAAGASLEPRPFRPVLRGLLLTGDGPRISPRRVVGRRRAGERRAAVVAACQDRRPLPRAVPGGAERGGGGGRPQRHRRASRSTWSSSRRTSTDATVCWYQRSRRRCTSAPTTPVGELMTSETLVVAPEDTIGEVAERMSELDIGAALVAEYGRLIGILTSRDMLAGARGTRALQRGARPSVDDRRPDHGVGDDGGGRSTDPHGRAPTSTTCRSSTANGRSAPSGCATS